MLIGPLLCMDACQGLIAGRCGVVQSRADLGVATFWLRRLRR